MVLYTGLIAIGLPVVIITVIANFGLLARGWKWKDAKENGKLFMFIFVWCKAWLYAFIVFVWLLISYEIAILAFG